MESKDLMIIVLGVLVIILAIIAVSALLGGADNIDDANDTNVDDKGNVTINIVTDGKKVQNITPVKNDTKPYVVERSWSDQYESYISVYSNGSTLIEKTGVWVDNIS